MTVSGNVRIGAMLFEVMGEGAVTYTVLTVNGGYFGADPRTWFGGYAAGDPDDIVQIAAEPEEYDGQADWAADSTTYTWRVKTSSAPVVKIGDVNGDGVVNMKDLTMLKKYVAGSVSLGDIILANIDIDGDGSIGIKDIPALRKLIAGTLS